MTPQEDADLIEELRSMSACMKALAFRTCTPGQVEKHDAFQAAAAMDWAASRLSSGGGEGEARGLSPLGRAVKLARGDIEPDDVPGVIEAMNRGRAALSREGSEAASDKPKFKYDGEGFGAWDGEKLPTWLVRQFAPYTAEGRARRLSELYAALVAAHPTPTSEPSLIDQVWRAVDVLGAPDTACTTDEERAYCRAIGDALKEIEKLGGRWS